MDVIHLKQYMSKVMSKGSISYASYTQQEQTGLKQSIH